jgi:DNA-3-methyladenine glycosylase
LHDRSAEKPVAPRHYAQPPSPDRQSDRRQTSNLIETFFTMPTTALPHAQLDRSFFDRSVHRVAAELIGATLLVDGVGGVIVEVEAYHHTDPAAHSYVGRTARNGAMFGPPGHAYVYRSYGIHWCVNAVCEGEGEASAVLIRALAPIEGLDTMRARRGIADQRLLCSGPGRLCQALGITRTLDGARLDAPPFLLLARPQKPEIVAGPRIGITKAAERPWRYGLKGSPFLSRPFRTTSPAQPAG